MHGSAASSTQHVDWVANDILLNKWSAPHKRKIQSPIHQKLVTLDHGS